MKLLLCLLLVIAPAGVVAQKYPAKPVRLVLPFAAGSAVDVLARIYGQKMSEAWDNRCWWTTAPASAASSAWK